MAKKPDCLSQRADCLWQKLDTLQSVPPLATDITPPVALCIAELEAPSYECQITLQFVGAVL
jgi:hypothetical protein